MGICRKAVANCLLRSEIIVYIVDRLCCAVYNVNYFALRNTQEMFPGYFALLWKRSFLYNSSIGNSKKEG